MRLNEARTRAERINPQLEVAGWDLSDRTRVRLEVPVEGYDPTPWNGFTDFSLYEASGQVIAVVEAKRTARNPREGEEQLRQYIAEIARNQPFVPLGFMSNGLHTYFWDVGLAHPRMVAGFFTAADLDRLKFIRENQQPLVDTPIDNSIVDRGYQHEAIRRVCEAFTAGRRRALLVMATGTGKTRTTMGLIDVCMRSFWAQRILFLADRDALVEQALTDGFKAHLPAEPRVRIHTANIDKDSRLYVATLQTVSRCFESFSPAFFDVIVFDEAHRSIFNRFTEVIEYFDARMVGLTATPASFIARDTFRVFDCPDQAPTFLYTYQQAIAERRLVDFRLYQAHTSFQRKGIRAADLTEEDREALIDQGLDPDSIDYSGTDLEVLVSNRDTLRRQWEEIMEVCIKDRAGNLPGKTIVFAITKAHAERIRDVFEEMFPQHVGVLQLIHHGVERAHDGPYGDGLISKLKREDKPRIAVSVDMLDTGIDVPEVVNLVFMKPVHSSDFESTPTTRVCDATRHRRVGALVGAGLSPTTVQLGDACDFIRGVTFESSVAEARPLVGTVPILRAGNIGTELDTEHDLVWVPETLVSEEQLLRRNDIVICMSSGSREVVGKTARVRESVHASFGSFCGVIRPRRAEWASFLSFYFRSRAFAVHRDAIARGANIQNLRFSQFAEIEVPMPSEHQEIAVRLERVDRLRHTRQYILELSRSLSDAVFRERFEDSFSDRALRPFGELVRITGGGTPARAHPEYFQGRTPWLTSKDMRGDYIWDTEEHITDEAIAQSATKLVPADSILVVVKSKVLMHRLLLAIAKVALCHGQDIKSIQCLEGFHHEFARFVLKHHERRLLHVARGANTEGLTLPMLEELPVPDVEYADQVQFAELVTQHEKLHSGQREALRQTEHLFESLLSQVF